MGDSTLWHRLECPCNPGFRYKSCSTFGSHFHTNRHQLHELEKKSREQRIRLGVMESQMIRLRQQLHQTEKSRIVLAHQYKSLNDRLSQESQRSKTLEDTLIEVRHKQRNHAAIIISYAARAWIARSRHARLQEHCARADFAQCLRHMKHAHEYRRALQACYRCL